MTIEKGKDWGRTGIPPVDLLWCDDDTTAAEHWAGGVREIGLRGGDMARTLGAGVITDARDDQQMSVTFPIDVIALRASTGEERVALAHVVVRHRRWGWWRRSICAVMNAQFVGRWDVAPRGHPNDGRVEVLEVDATMSMRQRVLAGRRLSTGAHLPHPSIRTRSTASFELVVPPSARLEVDGKVWRPGEQSGRRSSDITVSLRVVADALTVWIAESRGTVGT